VVDSACGVHGVLMSVLVCMGQGFGRISEGVGRFILVMLGLIWKMASMLDFGMICGVGASPLKKPFQTYMALPVYRMLQ
jgi:hypothetical protein